MSENDRYSHWELMSDSDNILWLYFNKADSSANVLDQTAITEFEEIIESLMGDTAYQGLVIASKKTNFIAGADIKSFLKLQKTEDAYEFMRHVQKIYSKLEHLSIPTVALIDGFCLGGGLELALACRYRIACDSAEKGIGFPEILLGIFPAWGGTVRSMRLVGFAKTVSMVLTGKLLKPSQAKRLGWVDMVQPKRHLQAAARACILGKARIARKKRHFSNLFFAKFFVLRAAKQRLAGKHVTPEHYPAPFAFLTYLAKASVHSPQAFIEEAHAASGLIAHPTTKQLVRLFFLRDRLKKLTKNTVSDIKHVHVVGAGTMGAGIAACCAKQGLWVTLQDQAPAALASAIRYCHQTLSQSLKEPLLIRDGMDRITPDPEGRGVRGADVIIEAIVESLPEKQALFKQLEAKAKPEALLATNTSSIRLEDIASAMATPNRLVGLHFFNPVPKMPLVEVISSAQTETSWADKALHLAGQLSKLPVPVNSGPGFLVNRLLMPYLYQAFKLYEEGIAPVAIDKLAVDFGMPMGPVTLADMVGLDVCLHILEEVGDALQLSVPAQLQHMVDQGKLGVKSGEGFYRYKNGKAKKPRTPIRIQEATRLTQRLIYPMLNEAVACLREGIVADADLLDAAMVFGTGFAPFRGGPVQYAKTIGITSIVTALKSLHQQDDKLFNVDTYWDQLENAH